MKLSEAMEVSSEDLIKQSDPQNLNITTFKTFLENESTLIDQKLNRDNVNEILNAWIGNIGVKMRFFLIFFT